MQTVFVVVVVQKKSISFSWPFKPGRSATLSVCTCLLQIIFILPRSEFQATVSFRLAFHHHLQRTLQNSDMLNVSRTTAMGRLL